MTAMPQAAEAILGVTATHWGLMPAREMNDGHTEGSATSEAGHTESRESQQALADA
jgi:hypothetical protein